MTSPSVPVLQRIVSNVEKQPSGCWRWTRAHDVAGYGKIRIKGRLQTVHRVVYELMRGEIPDGFVIDHLCGNPPCCNPAHLEVVTQKENVRRGKHGSKTHCPMGHPYSGSNLFITKRGRRTCRACRKRWKKPYVPVQHRRQRPRRLDWSRIADLYQSGLSMPEVAAKLGCSAGTVCKVLHSLGVKTRRRGPRKAAAVGYAIKKLMEGSIAA